jgi:predicted nucleic acid-binding protein
MPLYLLDTNHVRLLEQCSLPFMNYFLTHIDHVATSAISVQEVFKGRLAAIARARKPVDLFNGYQFLEDSLAVLAQLPIVQYDAGAELEYQSIRALKLKNGTQDQRIAATALANNLTLVTENSRDFIRHPRSHALGLVEINFGANHRHLRRRPRRQPPQSATTCRSHEAPVAR